MTHSANTKQKWKTMQAQIDRLASLVQQLANVTMNHEDELKKMREPSKAKESDYFPVKNDDETISGEGNE